MNITQTFIDFCAIRKFNYGGLFQPIYLWYLGHLPQPQDEIAAIADLTITISGTRLPVHSAYLGVHSKVIRDLLHPPCELTEEWKQGLPAAVQLAFDGFAFDDVKFYLALNYQLETFNTLWKDILKNRDLDGVMRIAAKQDAPRILEACNKSMLGKVDAFDVKGKVYWMGVGIELNLTELKRECAARLLLDCISKGEGAKVLDEMAENPEFTTEYAFEFFKAITAGFMRVGDDLKSRLVNNYGKPFKLDLDAARKIWIDSTTKHLEVPEPTLPTRPPAFAQLPPFGGFNWNFVPAAAPAAAPQAPPLQAG